MSKLGAAGANGRETPILKSDIVGAVPSVSTDFVYVGAEELTDIAPVSKLGADGALGGTTPIVKSDIVGAAPIANVGLVYAGAVVLKVTELLDNDGTDGTTFEIIKLDIAGTDGATGKLDKVISLGKSEVLFPIALCNDFIDAYKGTRYSTSSGYTAIAESP